MLVGVNQLSWLYLCSEYFDVAIPLDGRTVRVTHAKTASERLEPRVLHFVDIAYGAIRNRSHASQRAMDIAVHLTPERANQIGFIHIFHDNDFRSRDAGNVGAVLIPSLGLVWYDVFIRWLNTNCNRVANHGTHFGHVIGQWLSIEAVLGRIAMGDLFPPVVDGRRIPALELEQSGMRKAHATNSIRSTPCCHRVLLV